MIIFVVNNLCKRCTWKVDHLSYKQRKTFSLSCRDKGEARRFAGHLQKRNPNIKLENIQPEGNGTLQDLGAL